MRTVAYHCAQLFALTRQFPDNLALETYHVFYAGVLLMVMARRMPSVQDEQVRNTALPIDQLCPPDDPTSIRIPTFAEWRYGCGEVHGVPVLYSPTGWKQALEETIELLKRMKIWGIAQTLLRVLLKIRNEDMDVD